MKFSPWLIFWVGFCSHAIYGAETVTGRVVNGSASPLSVAKVWLKSDPATFDSTGSDGRFSLTLPTTSASRLSVPGGGIRSFTVRDNRLDFWLVASQRAVVLLFDVSGKKMRTMYMGRINRGHNSLPLDHWASSLANGAYILRFSGERISFDIRLTVADHQLSALLFGRSSGESQCIRKNNRRNRFADRAAYGLFH